MCNFFHCLGLMVLPDDGFVKVPHIQVWPYFPCRFDWISYWRYPWCWFYLWLQNVLFYHVVNGLFNCCLAFYWHLPPHMLYWWHCWVYLDVILSLERAKPIKTVRIESKKVLYTADLDWARFVKNRVLLWPGKLLGGGGFDYGLWVLVALEMALRVDVVCILIILWLVVLTFWQKTWNFTLGGCCDPGSRTTITVIWYGFYFTLGGCWDPAR